MAFWTLTVEYIRSRCCTTFMSSCRISKRSQKILHWTVVVFHSFSILFIGNHDNRDQLFCTLRVAKHYVWCWYVLEYQTTNTFISFLWPWHSSIQNWYGATKKSLDAKWKENSHCCCVISSNSSNASKNKMNWDKLGFLPFQIIPKMHLSLLPWKNFRLSLRVQLSSCLHLLYKKLSLPL